MHRYFKTEELISKAESMGHDHFDIYDEHRHTLLFVINGAKEKMQKGTPGRMAADFIERAGGTFLVETRSANSGNARKVITYVQCKKTFKDPDKPKEPTPNPNTMNGFQSQQTVDERIEAALNNYKQQERIKELEAEAELRNDKRQRTGEFLDMAMDSLINGIKKHYPAGSTMNGGNATVNDANYQAKFNNDIDDCLDILCDIFTEETLIKLANKLKNNPDPMVVNMVKDYANK